MDVAIWGWDGVGGGGLRGVSLAPALVFCLCSSLYTLSLALTLRDHFIDVSQFLPNYRLSCSEVFYLDRSSPELGSLNGMRAG